MKIRIAHGSRSSQVIIDIETYKAIAVPLNPGCILISRCNIPDKCNKDGFTAAVTKRGIDALRLIIFINEFEPYAIQIEFGVKHMSASIFRNELEEGAGLLGRIRGIKTNPNREGFVE